MKVYLAGPYCARPVLKDFAAQLGNQGHESTARWLHATHDIVPGTQGAALDLSDDYAYEHSKEDFEDIRAADILVVFTGQYLSSVQSVQGELHSGGRHVETGYALALGVRVITVGEPENIFQRGLCYRAQTFGAALSMLSMLEPSTVSL